MKVQSSKYIHSTTRLVLLVCLMLIFGTTVGCTKKSTEIAPEQGEEDSYDEFSDDVFDGADFFPEVFPEDFAQYPGSKITASSVRGETMASVNMSTSDSADLVVAFYADAASEGDWTESNKKSAFGKTTVTFVGEDQKINMVVNENPDGDGTVIMLMLLPGQ